MIRLGGLVILAVAMGLWITFMVVQSNQDAPKKQEPARHIATAVLKLDDALVALQSKDPTQREGGTIAYADAIVREGKHQEAESFDPLINLLLHDPEASVRATAATALGRLKSPHGLRPLLQSLDDDSKLVRMRSAGAIGRTTGIHPNTKRLNGDPADRKDVIERIRPVIEAHLQHIGHKG